MEEILLLLLLYLTVFPVVYYYIKNMKPCEIIGHDFTEDKKLDICSRCGLMKRKIEK